MYTIEGFLATTKKLTGYAAIIFLIAAFAFVTFLKDWNKDDFAFLLLGLAGFFAGAHVAYRTVSQRIKKFNSN